MENVKIDLFDLIRKILHQWKFILIVTLVCGLVFEGIGYARAYLSYRREIQGTAEEEGTADQYLSDMEDAEENLTEREISEVQIFAAAYPIYMAQYEEEFLYCQNAVKMQLNPNAVPTYTLHYSISNSGTDTQNASQVISAMTSLIQNEATCEEIRNALGWDTELGYIEDLIEVEEEGSADEDETIMDMLNTVNQMTVQIQAPEKTACETMTQIIKSHIEQEAQVLQGNPGGFEITLLSETYAEESDNTLRSFQEGRYSALNTLRGAINSLSSSMTDDQKEYYDMVVAYNAAKASEEGLLLPEEDETEEIAEAEEESVSPPDIIRTRFIILGLFLGLVLSCGYIFLRYLFAKNLRAKDDLEDAFQIPMLGYLPMNDRRQQFTREERMDMICAGIRIAIQKADLKNVYLTGTAGDGESNQVMEQIETALTDSGAQISSGRDVACDPASLEQMTASDGVVFVERVDRSPYADIQKEVELCQMYKVPVIGSVVIE